jgi:acyl-CoA synthetase (AMP-forming)/AMP-acid ligase II
MKRHLSFSHSIFDNERFDPDRHALIYQLNPTNEAKRKEVVLTYGALKVNSSRVASFLKSLGLKKGDTAVVLVPLCAELYEILCGLNRLGIIAVFFDAWASLDNIAEACSIIEPKVFFGISKAHFLRFLIKPISTIPIKIMVSHSAFIPKLPGTGYIYNKIIKGTENEDIITPLNDHDPQSIVFSTGSSGRPKGCIRDQSFAISSTEALNEGILSRENTTVEMVPWPGMILASFYYQRTVVVPSFEQGNIRQCDYDYTLQLMKIHNVSSIIAPPIFYRRLFRTEGSINKPIFKQIKLAITGGATVQETLLRLMQKHFQNGKTIAVYGSTEAEPISIMSAEQYSRQNNNGKFQTGICVGSVHPALKCKIIVDTDEVLFENDLIYKQCRIRQIGEIVVAGPQVSIGYYKNETAFLKNKIMDRNKLIWHRTGDLGYLDEENNLWIVGRKHNVVRKRKRNTYPVEAEALFLTIPGVEGAALVGYSDGEDGKQYTVLVLKLASEVEDSKIIKQADKLNTEASLAIDKILLSRYLPVDPRHNSKIDYNVLKTAVKDHLDKYSNNLVLQIKEGNPYASFIKQFWDYVVILFRIRFKSYIVLYIAAITMEFSLKNL